MRTRGFIAVAIVSVLALLPARGQSQTTTFVGASSRTARAVELQRQALALHTDPARASEAARLHRQSARLRGSADPEAVRSLSLAAYLFNYAHRPLDARRTMEEAAQRALAMGDVLRAAQAYVEAAFLAEKEQDRHDTNRLARKALLLAASPRLTSAERNSIVSRFISEPALASIVQ